MPYLTSSLIPYVIHPYVSHPCVKRDRFGTQMSQITQMRSGNHIDGGTDHTGGAAYHADGRLMTKCRRRVDCRIRGI